MNGCMLSNSSSWGLAFCLVAGMVGRTWQIYACFCNSWGAGNCFKRACPLTPIPSQDGWRGEEQDPIETKRVNCGGGSGYLKQLHDSNDRSKNGGTGVYTTRILSSFDMISMSKQTVKSGSKKNSVPGMINRPLRFTVCARRETTGRKRKKFSETPDHLCWIIALGQASVPHPGRRLVT